MNNLLKIIKAKTRQALSSEIVTSTIFSSIINKFFLGKITVAGASKASKQLIEDSYLKCNVSLSEKNNMQNLISASKKHLAKVDNLFFKARRVKRYIRMELEDNIDEVYEVQVDRSQGVLQIIKLEKDLKLLKSLNRLFDSTPQIKEILDAYGSPPITDIKLERKRTTVDNLSDYGYEYNMAHTDGYHTSLKIYIYLNDVTDEQGPLTVYKTTSNWNRHPKIAFVIKFFRQRYFSKDFCSSFDKNKVSLTGKAGDVVVFSGNSLHSASNVNKGYRETMQIYFDQFDKNWFSSFK